MPNFTIINGAVVNNTIVPINQIIDDLSYDNFGLQNSNIITTGDGFGLRDFPGTRINLTDIPQGNGQILNDTFYSGRNIVINGALTAESSDKLDELIDNFKIKLSKQNKLLKRRVNGEIRQVNATISNLTFGTKEKLYITFSATFASQDSFWEKGEKQSYLFENINTATFTEQISNDYAGTDCKIIIGFKSGLVGVNSIEVFSNGIGVQINKAINSNDLIVIDGINGDVFSNGEEIDFDGVFPFIENGGNAIEIKINGSYSADVFIIYPSLIP